MLKIRIAKRDNIGGIKKALLYVAAILAALLIGSVLLYALGVDAIAYYKDMLTMGLVGSAFAYKGWESFIKTLVPLLITSLALSLAFKMKFWNIGGEGQFIIGATVASAIAVTLGGKIPTALILVLMILAGGVAAGVYGLAAGALKVKFGTNETLMTLMMNYIAMYMLYFFGETKGSWNVFLDPASARPRFLVFDKSVWMPSISIGKFSLNISLILALLLVAFVWVYLYKTKHGYEISVVGDSIGTAKYAGMKVGGIMLRTVFLSAFLIGVAGACHVSTSHSLSTSITGNVGWTGIIVAWLAKLNPIAILAVSALISVLKYGCTVAASAFSSIDANFADLLQGVILFSVLVADFFIRFKLVVDKDKDKKKS